MRLKRREFFIGLENGVFQHNRPEPFIRVAEICTNPMAAYRSGAVPRLRLWRIGGIGQQRSIALYFENLFTYKIKLTLRKLRVSLFCVIERYPFAKLFI